MGKALDKPFVIKENGVKQRDGVVLSLPIVNALVERVLSGQTLYPKGGLEVLIPEGETGLKELKISRGTLNSWITRGNVVPETGEVLKTILDRAREAYRVNAREEKQWELLDTAEDLLLRVINVRTNVPWRDIKGNILTNEDGSTAYREDPKLLNATIKAAKFALERLAPEQWEKKKIVESKSAWSLNNLRQISREKP